MTPARGRSKNFNQSLGTTQYFSLFGPSVTDRPLIGFTSSTHYKQRRVAPDVIASPRRDDVTPPPLALSRPERVCSSAPKSNGGSAGTTGGHRDARRDQTPPGSFKRGGEPNLTCDCQNNRPIRAMFITETRVILYLTDSLSSLTLSFLNRCLFSHPGFKQPVETLSKQSSYWSTTLNVTTTRARIVDVE